MSTRPLGAQISHMLKARNVDVIFGIPGVHNVEMYRGIEEAGITHVLARHEQGAGFMADGYARASGKPGVAYVITGPGLCNVMTPMGQAYSDSVPMLVFSSCLDETAARNGQLHQMLDQTGAAATVCDWSETALTADAAYGLVDRAFAEFASTRPRTKHISVPIALMGTEATAAPESMTAPTLPKPAQAGIDQALELLKGTRHPLFVFGGGADKAAASARRVLAQLNAASFTTYAGRGIVAMDDPLHYGCSLAKPETIKVIRSADAIIAVGTELAEVDMWRSKLGHKAPMLRVDIDPVSLSDEQRAEFQVLSDAGAYLEALAEALEGEGAPRSSDWVAKDVAAARSRWRAETDAARPGITPICDALAEVMPQDAMIFSDMTQFAYVAKDVWEMPRAGHWHHPFGFGTLGYALPAAIGGAMARRDVGPTVCIAGDYGFQYTVQELGTAVELELPLPILLWDNGKLKEIEDSMVRSQIAPNAVIAHNPDFCALAEAYGAASAHPKTLEELQAALKAALTAKGPTLIYMTPELSS